MRLKLHKGLNLRLEGAVVDPRPVDKPAKVCAVVPDDFLGFVPKLDVAVGDVVMAGQSLMHDKIHPAMCLVAPVSGKVAAVVRGERRKILRVEVENDFSSTSKKYDTNAPLMHLLQQSGMLARMRTRPYDVVPDPDVVPRDIFVTALDTAPLALDPASTLPQDAPKMLALAAKALSTLAEGKVWLCVPQSWQWGEIDSAETVYVEGPHPAGLVGFQIANLRPVDKGDTVWTLSVATMYKIGRLLADGIVDCSATVAVVGPETAGPYVAATTEGCAVAALLEGHMPDDGRHKRVISGNVLTGNAVGSDGFLRMPYSLLTVIAEGDDVVEFMGWASVAPSKMSVWKSLPLRWMRRQYRPDARLNGGRRAMIMSGEYDRFFPADILPEYLLKAIAGRNIDEMEALGIYEVAPEDFALCEYADSSKMPLQQIVRDGLDFLRKELM